MKKNKCNSLDEIALFLCENNNAGRWSYTKDGRIFMLEEPINHILVDENFDLPEYISLNTKNDSIFDLSRWEEIRGPNHVQARYKTSEDVKNNEKKENFNIAKEILEIKKNHFYRVIHEVKSCIFIEIKKAQEKEDKKKEKELRDVLRVVNLIEGCLNSMELPKKSNRKGLFNKYISRSSQDDSVAKELIRLENVYYQL